MRTWDVEELGAEPHRPEILSSGDAARVIVLALPAGERLRGPWHPGAMTLDEKAHARERAKDRAGSN